MKIIIAGAGAVGTHLAQLLAKENQDITLVDESEEKLSQVADHVDLMTLNVKPTSIHGLKDAGAAVGRGIHIDTASKTSLPDVYAAGDCTECVDISSGDTKILALLPNAYKQGEIAGMNMAGAEKTFEDSIPMNAIGFFGLHMITAGTYTGEVIDKSQGENVKKLYCKDNLLKGYIMIGDVDKAGIYTSLIRDRVALDSIDFALVSETPGLMAFSKKYRDETLGGLRRGY